MYEVIKYIHNNINHHLSIDEISSKFGYSKFHFCNKFTQFTGRTFLEYVRHYRVSLASMDILNGEKVTDVALNYGYETVSGFNKAFLKEYGCLPREYKKLIKESQLYYEWRKMSMNKITRRCSILREEIVDQKKYEKNYAMQRIVYFSLGVFDAIEKGLSRGEIIASGMERLLNSFAPFIAPGEIIVGNNYGDGEIGEYFVPQNTKEHIELMKHSNISDSDIKKFLSHDQIEWKYLAGGDSMTADMSKKTEDELMMLEDWASMGRCISSNHSVIGYEQVLKKGFSGILSEIQNKKADDKENVFYKYVECVCKSAMILGEKYAKKAEELLETNNSEYEKEDLLQIIEICKNVPKNPAKSFKEAVQSIWFSHILNTWEDTINANSVGRLDQILYPYYKADIEKGIITNDEAFEIICLLWIKLYRDYDVQQSCVGGCDENGKSLVNELSYMMLDATEQLDFVRCLSVRFSKNTEKEFLKRALEVVGHLQKGVPFFFNDDVMIPSLIEGKIEKKDAYDYTQLGCVETVIPGKSNPHAVAGETNLLKSCEYVLCNGHSMFFPDNTPGIKTGELDKFKTYDDFYHAILKQIDKIIELSCTQILKAREDISPKPFKSMLTYGCIENGRDYNDKGAKYDYYQVMLGGIPNLADSLAVIKKFVYDENKYTLKEIKEILENNFPDEAVRRDFINKAPKFGNDIDEVDNIAYKIIDYSCDRLTEYSNKYNTLFQAQPFTYLWLIEHGKVSSASPDGRRKGEPIAYSVSPMQGKDFNGLSAVMNSISKLPTKRTPGTTSAIVEADPKLFTDKNIGALTDILVASGKKGLSNVQFNIVDAETLLDAQKNPDKYSNLAVRVSGFSQKFNLLTPDIQNHIIGRTKHKCL